MTTPDEKVGSSHINHAINFIIIFIIVSTKLTRYHITRAKLTHCLNPKWKLSPR